MYRTQIAAYGKQSLADLKLVVALGRANMAHGKMLAALLRRHGLTEAQFAVLEALYHKGPMRMSALVKTVLSTFGNMTVVVQNLVRSGMVTKQVCPGDNRAFLVAITERGAAKMEEVFPHYLQALAHFTGRLRDDDKKALRKGLKKLYTQRALR